MPIIHDEEFRAWEACVPPALRDDPVWRFNAYRVAIYLLDLASRDVAALRHRHASSFQTDQLLRAVASVSANVAEGLGRTSAAERSRFFGIALGSLREGLTWYRAIDGELSPEIAALRLDQFTELRKILIGAQKWLAAKPARTQLI